MTTSCNTNNANESSSLQRIFNTAWQKFIIEDSPPALEYSTEKKTYVCRYLTNDNRKCAIGLCIPEGHEAQKSKLYFSGLIREFKSLFPDLVNFSVSTLNSFQIDLHDSMVNFTTGKWAYTKVERIEKYLSVAKEYNLEVPS